MYIRLTISVLFLLSCFNVNALTPNASMVCDAPMLYSEEIALSRHQIVIEGWVVRRIDYKNFSWVGGSRARDTLNHGAKGLSDELIDYLKIHDFRLTQLRFDNSPGCETFQVRRFN